MNKALEATKELTAIAYDKTRSGWEDKKLERHILELGNIIETELKTFEIIRNSFDFSVELGSLPDGIPTYKLNVWCKGTPTVIKPISKDKYDLLKEYFK